MKQKLQRFMYGRNGADQLSRFLSIISIILLALSMFLGEGLRDLIFILAVASLLYTYFRVFSKSLAARRQENESFLRHKKRFSDKIHLRKVMWAQRKEYKFFKCPSCSATLRVPRDKGRIRIVCRKCGTSFEKKT